MPMKPSGDTHGESCREFDEREKTEMISAIIAGGRTNGSQHIDVFRHEGRRRRLPAGRLADGLRSAAPAPTTGSTS